MFTHARTMPHRRRDSPALVRGAAAPADLGGLDWLEDGGQPLDWNGPTGRTFTRFADDDMDRSIIDLFARVARQYPRRIAVSDSETYLSYAELWRGLSGLAETIAARTQPGDLIGVLLPAQPMFPMAILACLAAGRPFVALDVHYPGEWLGQALETARPALIITRADVLERLETGLPAPRVIDLTSLPRPARRGWRPAELGLDEPACVLFTSGSTGRPKGVVNSQRNLLRRVAQSINAAHINADDRFLTLASLCTIVGVRDALTALLAGASIHLLDPGRVGAREILNVIRAEAITILFAFPALLRSVAASSLERASGALRLVRVGGDTTLWSDMDLLRAWLAPDAAIQLIYAATEAPMMQWFVDSARRGDDARLPIGYPLPGARLALIDEHGRAAARGEVGELIVESPYVALGHWVDGRCVADSDESGAPSRRRFRTGDLARQRSDGLLERIGRKDRQVKIRGTSVDLDGVEAALRRHPHVRDAGALARTSDADGGASLVAYVSACDGAPVGLLEDLRRVTRAAPPAMRPGRLYLVGEIPRLPSSKLDVRTLIALDEAKVRGERAHVAGAPDAGQTDGDSLARTVAQVWRNLLQTPAPGPQDDFFDVGGDSLKAIALMIELERALGLELPLTLINEAPTFAELCQALKTRRATGYVPLVPLKAGDGSPPVYIVHGVGGHVGELFPIARRMTYPGAVIGIQARGLTGEAAPHRSVEAMAADYLSAIKARQPRGPYHLCGYSFGGLVAFEMARRLRAQGDEVGLVGLFDTTTSPMSWPLGVWLSIVGRRLVRLASGRAWRRPPSPNRLKSLPAGVLKVAASAMVASARYRPGDYPGELTLFIPAGRDPSLPSPKAIWRQHARALCVVDTAGVHLTMLAGPNAESTAASLTRCLGGGPDVSASFDTRPAGAAQDDEEGLKPFTESVWRAAQSPRTSASFFFRDQPFS
jgi:non-ribosomal peptide synthetase component F/thioesterase domain-containing protein/acyl carrier protein